MIGEPWVYWLGFVVAVALWVAVPIVARYERLQDERDRELWNELWR